jgi:homocitrate synthase NifV
MVIGKHSGSHGLQERLGRLGICLGDADAARLLEQVRGMAQVSKRALSDLDLVRLYDNDRKVA